MWRGSVFMLVVVVGVTQIAAGTEDQTPREETPVSPIATPASGRARLVDAGIQRQVARRVADARFWSLAAGVYLTGAGDWATTQQFRRQGLDEANPLLAGLSDSPAGLAAVKLGGGTLVNWISLSFKKHGKRYWAVPQIVWIALNAVVSVHNHNALD